MRRWWRRYRLVAVTVIAIVLAGLVGLIGAGRFRPLRLESFDRKQIVVEPSGADGVRITEVVDIDFGIRSRHGYERVIPNDFGVPTDVTATSSADPSVNTVEGSSTTRIRVGSPDRVFRGRQRYVLTYTLPDAGVGEGRLSLDVIGTEDSLATGRLDIWLVGFDLSDAQCDVGRYGWTGGCELVPRDGMWWSRIDDLGARRGVTVTATVNALTSAASPPIAPPLESGWPHWWTALLLAGACAATIGLLYSISLLVGGNRVAPGGPTAAAFPDASSTRSRFVLDTRLDELATIEFEPPTGMRPWQGALALSEVIDDRTIVAWFSDMIAAGALVIDDAGSALRRGDGVVPEPDRRIIDDMFKRRTTVGLGYYSTELATAWSRVALRQQRFAAESGWWHRNVPTANAQREPWRPNWSVISFVVVCVAIASLILFRSLLVPLVPVMWLLAPRPVAVALAVIATVLAAHRTFAPVRPARTVAGSAAALRVRSFQRFLDGSEGVHTDAAWDRGRIREYSAWAVALDAATAWSERVALGPAPEQTFPLGRWMNAFDRLASTIESGLLRDTPSWSATERPNPWRSIGRALAESWDSGSDSGSGSGWSGGGGGSSGVGSGGGGGRSGSW